MSTELQVDQSLLQKARAEGAQAPDRVLQLMQAIILDGGASPLSALAEALGLANSSARRLAALLEERGYVSRVARGRYGVGPAFVQLARHASGHAYLCNLARAPLRQLARAARATAHLGILENEMVTYLQREGAPDATIVTDVGAQLEAYCTGIGKVLLAGLGEPSREAYLRAGDFVQLTPNTITDVEALRQELSAVRRAGYGLDRAEMFERLHCLAVPVVLGGATVAAISISRTWPVPSKWRLQRDLILAQNCVAAIQAIADPAVLDVGV